MRQHEYAKIGRVIENMHPEMVQGILNLMKPELKDTSNIAIMYSAFKQDHDTDEFINKLTFIAAILKLYCPSALLLNCRATDRVCLTLTEIMGYNFRQSVSHLISQTRVYIKNPVFRESVERVSVNLMEVA